MTTTGPIGARIRECRELMGYTREQLAEKVNVSPRFIYDIELGNKGMSMETLAKMGDALNIPVDYILLGRKAENMPISPETLALIERCPDDRMDNLNEIIKNFILAIEAGKK